MPPSPSSAQPTPSNPGFEGPGWNPAVPGPCCPWMQMAHLPPAAPAQCHCSGLVCSHEWEGEGSAWEGCSPPGCHRQSRAAFSPGSPTPLPALCSSKFQIKYGASNDGAGNSSCMNNAGKQHVSPTHDQGTASPEERLSAPFPRGAEQGTR